MYHEYIFNGASMGQVMAWSAILLKNILKVCSNKGRIGFGGQSQVI